MVILQQGSKFCRVRALVEKRVDGFVKGCFSRTRRQMVFGTNALPSERRIMNCNE